MINCILICLLCLVANRSCCLNRLLLLLALLILNDILIYDFNVYCRDAAPSDRRQSTFSTRMSGLLSTLYFVLQLRNVRIVDLLVKACLYVGDP